MGKYDKKDAGAQEGDTGDPEQDAPDRTDPINRIKTKEIDGIRYRCKPFGALKQIDMAPKVMALFGQSAGLAGDALFGGYGAMADLVQVGKAIDTFAQKIAEVGGSDFIADMLSQTHVLRSGEAQPMSADYINQAYGGRLTEVLKIFMFALEVNYGDFFGSSRDSAARLKISLFDWLESALTQAIQSVNDSTSG